MVKLHIIKKYVLLFIAFLTITACQSTPHEQERIIVRRGFDTIVDPVQFEEDGTCILNSGESFDLSMITKLDDNVVTYNDRKFQINTESLLVYNRDHEDSDNYQVYYIDEMVGANARFDISLNFVLFSENLYIYWVENFKNNANEQGLLLFVEHQGTGLTDLKNFCRGAIGFDKRR